MALIPLVWRCCSNILNVHDLVLFLSNLYSPISMVKSKTGFIGQLIVTYFQLFAVQSLCFSVSLRCFVLLTVSNNDVRVSLQLLYPMQCTVRRIVISAILYYDLLRFTAVLPFCCLLQFRSVYVFTSRWRP